MSFRIDNSGAAGQLAPMGMGSGAAGQLPDRPQTGMFKGDTVTVKDAASALDDAKEEISQSKSAEVSEKSKRFGELDVKAETRLRIQQVEEVTAYLEASQKFGSAQELAALAKRMQSGDENPRGIARQRDRDPSGQFMLMQYALADGEANGAPAAGLERLREALEDLEMDFGPQIRAGINTMGVAAEVASGADAIEAFQNTYRDVVLAGDQPLAQTLTLMVDRLGGAQGERFAAGLNDTIRALGADVSATRPSTDANRLNALIQDLYQLEVVSTVLDACRDLSANLRDKFGAANVEPVALLKDLVAITGEKWVSSARFESLAGKFGVEGDQGQIAFQMGNKTTLRALPLKIFSDPDSRQTILNAVQDALDVAIAKEEEA